MTPTLIITRPAHVAQATADDYRASIDQPFDLILSPLIRIVPCDPPAFDPDPDHVIFTSANAVAQVDRIGLSRRATAWCVGGRTAQAAKDAGFAAQSVDGTGRDLLQLLRDKQVSGTVLHVHGRETYVDFAQELGAGCTGICVYDQITQPPNKAAIAVLAGTAPVIIPLYSPKSARTLLTDTQIVAPAWFIGMSAHTTDQIRDLHNDARCVTAKAPDQAGMIDATRQVFAALTQDTSP